MPAEIADAGLGCPYVMKQQVVSTRWWLRGVAE